MAERHDLAAPGVDLRHHHRGLVGLGAAGGEEALLELPRGDARELLGQLDDRDRGVERRDVPQPIDLRLDGGVDLVVAVTHRDGEDATEEVQVLAAVEVADPHAFPLGEHDRLLVVVRHRREQELLVLSPNVGGADRGRGCRDLRVHCATHSSPNRCGRPGSRRGPCRLAGPPSPGPRRPLGLDVAGPSIRHVPPAGRSGSDCTTPEGRCSGEAGAMDGTEYFADRRLKRLETQGFCTHHGRGFGRHDPSGACDRGRAAHLPPRRRKMCDALVAPAVGTALLLTALSLPAADDSTATVVDAERSFARYSVEHGMREAFLQFLADDAILFRPLPVNGKKWFEGRPPAPGALLWQPTYARVSEAGDLGVTSGPWEFKPSDTTAASSFGHFLTVWRKQADGTWRVEL